MAKVIEQVIALKLSKIVRDNDKDTDVLTGEKLEELVDSLPPVIEETINDKSICVEIIDLA